ncbi:hypothetical protein PR371_00720 [Mycobacterium marinum]|uniref:hypothetical protein n=1 Tax=Mycobacterium marinum TaxID=1781 RepID=UPI0023418651|nr:hypothetical protein [Mycobacterium marinum]MDC8992503.1 hypothetical protein [Mycobacterium marinum]WDZ15803.1 hypothetical protein PQR73_009755 [Mycobacterium marinum]
MTITATTKHGKRKLRSFDWLESDHGGEWWLWFDREVGGDAYPEKIVRSSERYKDSPPPYHGDILRREFSLAGMSEVIRIGRNLEVPLSALRVICDAMRSAGKHEIDIDNLKSIVSRHGSRLAAIETLPKQRQRHAAELLHREIGSAVLE